MPKNIVDARNELLRLGRVTPQIPGQEDTLKLLEQKDFPNEATLLLILAQLDAKLSTRASQATLATQLDITLSALRDAIIDGASPKDLKDLWDKLESILGQLDSKTSTLAKETGGNLASIKAKTDNLNITLSVLRDAITDGASPKDLKDLYDQLILIKGQLDNKTSTLATQTTLALIKAKTDNLDVALSTKAKEAGGNLAALAALDFAEQTTLALIKAKTDLLATIPKEASATPTSYNVTMTNVNTQYLQALPNGTYQLTFFVRGGDVVYRYAWVTGKVAAPTAPYTEVPANGIVFLDKCKLDSKTLYFACGIAGRIMQIEVLT